MTFVKAQDSGYVGNNPDVYSLLYQMTVISGLRSFFRPPVFVLLAFATMLGLSWHRWTSLIVDNGRETDLPFRLMNGEMLYRDIHYTYTPFSPYFNAGLYRIFGAHIDTLAVSGIFFSMVLTFLCYRIARKLMPAGETAIATCLVVVLCIFKPAGNLILPYSFGALHATVFSLACVLFTMRYAEHRRKVDLILAGIFIGFAGIAKQEFAFAGAITVTLSLVFLHRTRIAKLVADLAFAAIPAMVIVGAVLGLLFATMDWQMLVNDCHLFYTNIPESLVFYNRFRSGLNYPLFSVFQMFGAAAVCVAFVSLIILISDKTGMLRRIALLTFTIAAIVTTAVLLLSVGFWDGSPMRALPFMLIGMMFVAWRRNAKAQLQDPAAVLLSIAAVYGFAILIRVVLRVPSGGFSGSFFLPASLCLAVYALLYELPRYIKQRTGDDASFAKAKLVTRVFCIGVIVTSMISFGFRFRTKYVYEIAAQRGTVIVEKDAGPVIDETLKFIEVNTAPDDFIAVVPEGNDLAFLSGRRINLRHQVLLPDFLSHRDELDAIAAIQRDNVRYIFVPNRAMREFGSVAFGRDFYQTMGNWIEENYHLIKVFGLLDGQTPEIGRAPFFVKVYERK